LSAINLRYDKLKKTLQTLVIFLLGLVGVQEKADLSFVVKVGLNSMDIRKADGSKTG
jgi:hypothetical protein